DLFDAAKLVGTIANRSAAQQINHWARIGRELEASPGTSLRDIRRVLPGEASYDDFGEHSQAVMRAIWDEQMAEGRARLNLAIEAAARRYLVHAHVILVPVDLAVTRVAERVQNGGHPVPERKVRERYARLWSLVTEARSVTDRMEFFDNSVARHPFQPVATYEHGLPTSNPDWPTWAPAALTA
ncbi:MAG TPA: hypothetical protein VFQ96_00535, partial [Microbacteriaceae bacterium]|nr:hypothetical protein [Microbacteriaceae bacterium]